MSERKKEKERERNITANTNNLDLTSYTDKLEKKRLKKVLPDIFMINHNKITAYRSRAKTRRRHGRSGGRGGRRRKEEKGRG